MGVANVLIKYLPFGKKIIYIPRGPLLQYDQEEDVYNFSKLLKDWASSIGAIFVKTDPFIINDGLDNQVDKPFNSSFSNVLSVMKKSGFMHLGFNLDMEKSFQPRFNCSLSLFDENFERLSYDEVLLKVSKKTRPKMRGNLEEKGVVIERYSGNEIDFEEIERILAYTEKRQNISLRNAEYFRRFADAYGDRIVAYFARVNLDKHIEYLEKMIAEGKNINVNKNKLQSALEIKKIKGTKPVLATGFAFFPDKNSGTNIVEYLYAGADIETMPYLNLPINIVGKFIKETIEREYDYFNIGGVNGTLDDHLAKYKLQFGPNIWEFIGEFDLVVNKFYYYGYVKGLPIFKKIIKSPVIRRLFLR